MYKLIDFPKEGYKVAHADLEATDSAADFILQLMDAISNDEKLNALVTSIDFVSGIWRSLRGAVEEVGLYAVKLKLREQIQLDWQARGKAILEKIAESEARIVFVLDEFPMMLEAMIRAGKKDEAKLLLRWFRALRLSPKIQDKVRFVLAGSIGIDRVLGDLEEIASINDFEKLKLTPFSPATAHEFLGELCDTHNVRLDEEVKGKILDLVGAGVPYFIQVFFSELYKSTFESNGKIDTAHVERIYRDQVLGIDCKTYFEHYYGRLRTYYDPENERAARSILRELAVAGVLQREACFQIYKQQFGGTGDLEKFVRLMGDLENDFYISSVSNGHEFEFGSKLLRDWWLRHYGMSA